MPEYRTQQVGEESVRYVHQGSGHPLLFMHGFSIRPHFYEKLIDALSEEHEVIAPEMYGINAFKDQPATMDEYAELTKEFVQAMHLGSHNMAGHSMGGGVAIMLAPDSANDTRLALMEPMCPIDFKYVASESFLRVVYKTARQLKGSTGGLDATIFGLKGMGFTTDLAKNVTATLGIVRDIVNFTHEKGFPRSTLYFMTEDDEMLPYTDELRDELRKDENVDLRILEGNVGHDWPVIIPNVYDSAKRINDFLTGDEMTEKLLKFDEFADRSDHTPTYDNFIYFFYPDFVASDVLRTQPFFTKFQEYYPDLERKLSEEIPEIRKNNPTFEGLEPLERDLYTAYCFMRSYGADNESLIGLTSLEK